MAREPGWFEPGSRSEAVVRGFSQGATLGFGDEIQAGLRSMFSDRTYKQLRDEERKANAAAAQANPGTYTATNVVGSLPAFLATAGVGGSVAGAALGTGVASGVQGLGNASGSAREQLSEAGKSALTGAALGAGGKAIGNVAEKAKALGPILSSGTTASMSPVTGALVGGALGYQTGGVGGALTGAAMGAAGRGALPYISKVAATPGGSRLITGSVNAAANTVKAGVGPIARNAAASAASIDSKTPELMPWEEDYGTPSATQEAPMTEQKTQSTPAAETQQSTPSKVDVMPWEEDYGDTQPTSKSSFSALSEHPAVQSNPLLPTFFAGLAQLETAGGKKTIKGSDGQDTNNLFNIKDFSKAGTGIRARDKAEGSNDRYRTYASHDESTADLIGLLQRKYPKALSARTPEEFAYALKEGGYATDPKYVSKLVGTINSRMA